MLNFPSDGHGSHALCPLNGTFWQRIFQKATPFQSHLPHFGVHLGIRVEYFSDRKLAVMLIPHT